MLARIICIRSFAKGVSCLTLTLIVGASITESDGVMRFTTFPLSSKEIFDLLEIKNKLVFHEVNMQIKNTILSKGTLKG